MTAHALEIPSISESTILETLKDIDPKFNLATYAWADPKNERDFMMNAKGAVLSLTNGFKKQVPQYRRQCYEILSADRGDHALALIEERGLHNVRYFCNYPSSKSRQTFRVRGKGSFDWHVMPADDYLDQIPVPALEALTALRKKGAEPDSLHIGVAVPRPQPKPKPVSDPVLLLRFGKFFIEAYRWG